jgi:hypothetical protein
MERSRTPTFACVGPLEPDCTPLSFFSVPFERSAAMLFTHFFFKHLLALYLLSAQPREASSWTDLIPICLFFGGANKQTYVALDSGTRLDMMVCDDAAFLVFRFSLCRRRTKRNIVLSSCEATQQLACDVVVVTTTNNLSNLSSAHYIHSPLCTVISLAVIPQLSNLLFPNLA